MNDSRHSSVGSGGTSNPIGSGSTPDAGSIFMSDAGPDTVRINLPEPKWWLEITPDFKITQNKRPNWLHRSAMRLIFGWKWSPYS